MDYKGIITSAENIYNSYLLLNKLSGLKDRENVSLSDLVSQSTKNEGESITLKIGDKEYTVKAVRKEEGKYEIKLVGHSAQSPDVKEINKYSNHDIIDLWSNRQVFLNTESNGACSFSVAINDELEVGGPGKMIPFELRFFIFIKLYKPLREQKKKENLHLKLYQNT